MTATRRVVALLLLATVAAVATAQSRVTMSLGHNGTVQDITGRPDLPLAFTVGDDGKLRVWDLEHDGLRYAWQVSQSAVTDIALHPQRNEAVLFVQDGVTSGRLVALNWESGEELFTLRLGSRPRYLDYSPQGTYIVYALPSFDSIYFLDAEDGSTRRYLDDGFGIVSFVQMARSERNVMTYVPSRGEFIYWQLRTGNELQTVATQSRLEHVTLVDPETQRFLAAYDGEQLVVVDNLTGQVRATHPVSPVHDITYDETNGRIFVLSDQFDRRTVLAFTYSSGRLRREFYRPQNLSAATTRLVPVGDEQTHSLLGGARDGELARYDSRSGRRTVIGPADLSPIADIAFTPGRMHLSLGGEVLSVVSDLFDADRGDVTASFMRQSRIALPDATELNLTADADRLLAWGPHEPGTVWEIVPSSGVALPVYDDEFDVPLADVKATESGPLVVHRDGRIVHVDRDGETERFRYIAIGAQDAVWDPQIGLIAAKTRVSVFDASIIVVDQLTMETVAADTDAFLTTRIALDRRSDKLYAIGLHGRQTAAETRLLELTGEAFGASTILARENGELSRGDLLWDPVSDSLYSTLNNLAVHRYTGRRDEALEPTEHLHAELAAAADLIVASNFDGSASVWRRSTGDHLVDVYAIDGEWIAISKVGTFIASSRRIESYLTFLPAERTTLTLDDFRVTPPLRVE